MNITSKIFPLKDRDVAEFYPIIKHRDVAVYPRTLFMLPTSR